MEFLGVDGLFELWRDGVEGAGEGGDENEGTGEDAGVELEPEHERPEPSAAFGPCTDGLFLVWGCLGASLGVG